MILHWDCIQEMQKLEENSIDSIVCDPPYWLSFMGKKWDYDVPWVEVWQECLRVLKPWGHLLAFAWTRTQHRMCCNIEDAGFEIRDMIAWIYWSWFPKSLNIGKAVDKLQGNEREIIDSYRNWEWANFKHSWYWISQEQFTEAKEISVTQWSSEWEWYWTALKPALESITLARKPLSEKTIAKNVLKWGTGGINIDKCRVWTNDTYDYSNWAWGNWFHWGVWRDPDWSRKDTPSMNTNWRFPANLIHDWSGEVLEVFPETKTWKLWKHSEKWMFWSWRDIDYSDQEKSWSAARFFYCSKASKKDRGEGNTHATVKPTKLMKYLITLVTPKWGTVLDPFAWSGTTGVSAKELWVDYILIEKEQEYINIIKQRLK